MKPAIRLTHRGSVASQLERDLEESLKLVEMVRSGAAFVGPENLPDALELNSTHAQLARLVREGAPKR